MAKRYTLDEKAAQKLRRLLHTVKQQTELRKVERKNSPELVAKIEAHEGSGIYQGVEVFWDTGAWVTNGVSRKFGAAYSTKGLHHLNASEDIPVDSYVIAFPFQVDKDDEVGQWVFGEPGEADAWHPFKAHVKSGTMDRIEVGYLRVPPYSPADQMTVFDQDDPNQTTQIKTISDSAMVTSAALSGDGYLYYVLNRDGNGNWSYNDDPQRAHDSAVWPPTPDTRDTIPVLIGNYEKAGTANFKWYQVLRDDPVLWPRPMLPSFYPIYYTEPSPTPHAAVHIAAGKIHFRSTATYQDIDVVAQNMDLTVDKFYYLEVTSAPTTGPNTVTVTVKIEAAYPGYVTVPNKVYYLIGKTVSGRYTPLNVGDIWDGTLHQPQWSVADYQWIDERGLEVWAGLCTHIQGAGAANSDFLKIYKPGLHFKFGDINQNKDGSATTIGGTDDDVVVQYVYDVTLDCSAHRLVIKHKKLTLTVTSGIVVVNKIEDEADTYINLVSVDAVTSLQVSGTAFQKKTTKLYGLCNDAESAWSTWHVGTVCPTPAP